MRLETIYLIMEGCRDVYTLVLLSYVSLYSRPAAQPETLTLGLKQHEELCDGPLQYIIWRKMLKSISPGVFPCFKKAWDKEIQQSSQIAKAPLNSVHCSHSSYCSDPGSRIGPPQPHPLQRSDFSDREGVASGSSQKSQTFPAERECVGHGIL